MNKEDYKKDTSRVVIHGFKESILLFDMAVELLTASKRFELIEAVSRTTAGHGWEADITVRIGSEYFLYKLTLDEVAEEFSWEPFQNHDPNLLILEELESPQWILSISTRLYNLPTFEWQQQLKVAEALLRGREVIADYSSYIVFSQQRISFLTRLKAPPSYRNLYKQEVQGRFMSHEGFYSFWVHTHGLRRIAGVELEMIGLPYFEEALSALLDAAAAAVISGALATDARRLSIGFDITVKLLPWAAALKYFPSSVAGGISDRQQPEHRENSLVLYVKKGEKIGLVGPEYFVDGLRSGEYFLSYPYFIQNDVKTNARALWNRLIKFVSVYGGQIRVEVLIDDSLLWFEYKEEAGRSIKVFADGSRQESISIKKENIFNWSLELGNDIYGAEDFFILQNSIRNKKKSR
jgi:hypothetical protein